MNGKGSEVMITAYVHHISSVHRQLSVWTYIYMKCIHMKNILPLGETDRNMAGPEASPLTDGLTEVRGLSTQVG